MRKFACLMGLVLLLSVRASAQDHSKVDVFGGYSFLRYEPGRPLQPINYNGGVGSISYNPIDWIGFVGEIGGYHTDRVRSAPGISSNAVSYLFGPKIYMSRGKITPFGQVLFGGTRVSCSNCGGTPSENAFTMAIGGGFDWNAGRHFAVRLGQVEYLMTTFKGTTTSNFATDDRQNNFRYSVGVLFRF
jgi:opacity protein-like surface antigen